MIRISAKRDGFRRCGIAHSKAPVEHPDDRFTAAELKLLKGEKNLVVEVVTAGTDRPNAKISIALAEAATSIEALDALATDEDRKTVIDAIAKRRAELTPE